MKVHRKNLLIALTMVALISIVMGRSTHKDETSAEPVDRLRTCQENLSKLATAMEMYSVDYRGRYPASISKLLPNYLIEVPVCPATGTDTYTAGFQVGVDSPANTEGWQDFYQIACGGHNHGDANLGPNLPSINCMTGHSPPR